MLGQGGEDTDQGQSKRDGKPDASEASGLDRLDGAVALCRVCEGSVGKDVGRLVRGVDEPTLGSVGQRIISVDGIVPELEGRQVEVIAAEDGVGVVLALGELEQIARVDGRPAHELFEGEHLGGPESCVLVVALQNLCVLWQFGSQDGGHRTSGCSWGVKDGSPRDGESDRDSGSR